MNWKYLSITLVVVLVIFVFWYYKIYEPKNNALGRAKKNKNNPKQLPIDFAQADQEGKSKLIAVNDVISLRSKQRELLRMARTKDPVQASYYLELAEQYHKESKNQENYLNRNYANLKGLQEDKFWSMFLFRKIELSPDIEIDFLIDNNITIDEITDIYNSNLSKWIEAIDENGNFNLVVFGYSFRFLAIVLQLNYENGNLEATEVFYPNDDELEQYYFGKI